MIKVINGNSIEELKKYPDNYFGSVVTDPPYGLSAARNSGKKSKGGFMGKKWDYDVPSVELWQEVFRVLKEGGYLLSFAGTRTQHRMAVNIEDAGFEIRDMIAWVYGSGFPKSHNIGKAVDKLQGSKREIVGETRIGKTSMGDASGWDTSENMKAVKESGVVNVTKGNSQWEGWGTALKPALEPITMARKPFKGTVAENVLKNGVGGINIDGCRIETEEEIGRDNRNMKNSPLATKDGWNENSMKGLDTIGKQQGRFPANFIHDGSDEVKDLFPYTQSGTGAIRKNAKGMFGLGADNKANTEYGDKGSASRFFYCAKASKQDRNEGLEDFEDNNEGIGSTYSANQSTSKIGGNPDKQTRPRKNNHPTVKPTDLMRYLVRLVTPKNEIVLDCFMGSGSTGKACALEGLSFVGIDLDKDYCEIAKARIDKALEYKRIEDSQTKLF